MDVLTYLKTNKTLKLAQIAALMWPGNSDAKTYLSKKMNGKLPFTDEDAAAARQVLHDLGHKLIALE